MNVVTDLVRIVMLTIAAMNLSCSDGVFRGRSLLVPSESSSETQKSDGIASSNNEQEPDATPLSGQPDEGDGTAEESRDPRDEEASAKYDEHCAGDEPLSLDRSVESFDLSEGETKAMIAECKKSWGDAVTDDELTKSRRFGRRFGNMNNTILFQSNENDSATTLLKIVALNVNSSSIALSGKSRSYCLNICAKNANKVTVKVGCGVKLAVATLNVKNKSKFKLEHEKCNENDVKE